MYRESGLQKAMNLLIDIGNTRIKWATQDASGLSAQRAAAHATWTAADVRQQVTSQVQRPTRILVSNVAGERLATLLTEAAHAAWGMQPEFVRSSNSAAGIINAYRDPEKLGVDRWIGMIAAHRLQPGVLCVVGVGTAMTIDGLDATGRHYGGLITAGPALMVSSLLGGTSDIAARIAVSQTSDAILAHDTATAVRNGSRHALAALICRAAEYMQQQTGQPPTVILTGGASDHVESLLSLPSRVIPDLVLQGLCILAA